MHHSFTVLSAFAALGMASPIAAPPTKKAFTVSQVEAGKIQLSPVIGMLHTYNKFSATAPPVVQRAAAAAQSGSVVTTPQIVSILFPDLIAMSANDCGSLIWLTFPLSRSATKH